MGRLIPGVRGVRASERGGRRGGPPLPLRRGHVPPITCPLSRAPCHVPPITCLHVRREPRGAERVVWAGAQVREGAVGAGTPLSLSLSLPPSLPLCESARLRVCLSVCLSVARSLHLSLASSACGRVCVSLSVSCLLYTSPSPRDRG
eukprot:1212891-Rhodomonas_salina.1